MSLNNSFPSSKLNIFLSGTFDDLKNYRKKIKTTFAGLRQNTEDFAEWIYPNEPFVKNIKNRLRMETDLYLGLFGYRYGTIVMDDDEQRSITQFEYEYASQMAEWNGIKPRPIYVLIPEPGSKLDRKFRKLCKKTLKSKFEGDSLAIKTDMQQQARFLQKVQVESGLQYMTVPTERRLLDLAIHIPQVWRGDFMVEKEHDLLKEISALLEEKQRVQNEKNLSEDFINITNDVLWEPHATKVRTLLETSVGGPPGICMLAFGGENAGQKQFMRFLERENYWQSDTEPVFIGLFEQHRHNAHKIWQGLWQAADGYYEQNQGDPLNVTALARQLAQTCVDRPAVVLIEEINNLEGGLRYFIGSIWHPLHNALTKLWEWDEQRHSVIVLLTAKAAHAPDTDLVCDASREQDRHYDRAIALPELQPLTEDHLVKWLQKIDPDQKVVGNRRRWAQDNIENGRPGNVILNMERIIDRLEKSGDRL